MKLWGKTNNADTRIHHFTSDKDRELDQLLALPDIIGSIAHARMLGVVGMIPEQEAILLERELKILYQQVEKVGLTINPDCEDIHSHIEMVLTKNLGDTGRRIHTGRSRNDQVILAMRLFARGEMKQLTTSMKELFEVLMQQAEKHDRLPMPGYTHMQLAMPSSFGLWFSAFAESLAEDLIPVQAAYRMADHNPLGTGAGYGSSFPVNREMTTDLLGFNGMNVNSVYTQMSRTRSETTTAFALAGIASTLSRLANDICLYMGENYGFFSLSEEMTTGSSIMPHKKNPDVFELIRARCNRLQHLPAQLSAMAMNLPTGYHRDFQLFKESLLPAIADLKECLTMAALLVRQLRVSSPVDGNPLYERMYSVEEIDRLTQTGIPFREAYGMVAGQIKDATFKPDKHLTHTHTGSIGNPGFLLIRKKWETNLGTINFDKAEKAIRQLLKTDFKKNT
jgi:argininosuccinate lyase